MHARRTLAALALAAAALCATPGTATADSEAGGEFSVLTYPGGMEMSCGGGMRSDADVLAIPINLLPHC
ncbi:hypothetical protein [Streptomyces laurentii]|uniref:hypothetical protein n=1 Tax=Streptomyces laurentii TaxID=39478 RepID=UPI0036A904D5